MSFFNIVAATNEDTVVATYEPSKVRSDSYQSEAELEKEFIRLLCEQGYTYLPLHTEDELIANLRSQLEELNHYQFSDTEWRQFFSDVIANPNEQKLKEPETRKYLANAFRDGEIKTVGTDIDKLMPPVSRFGGGGRAQKKQGVIDKLKSFFDKFFGIGGSSLEEGKP